MTIDLKSPIPGPNEPMVDRYRFPSPVWYPWLYKIIEFIKQLASGQLIVDDAIQARHIVAGAITADAIAAGAIQADAIAAGAITVDALDVTNVNVLNGTFGTLVTNAGGSTYISISDDDNELRCYIGGTLVAVVGSDVITHGAFISCTSPSAAWYPATFYNSSTSGGLANDGGGALVCGSVGGYTIQSDQTTNQAGNYGGSFRNTTGGHLVIGASSGGGSYAAYAAAGTIGPFTGSHDGLLSKSESVDVGDILVDGQIVGRSISDAITEVSRSTGPNQVGFGVFVNRVEISEFTMCAALSHSPEKLQAYAPSHDMAVINAVGEGAINVCGEAGNIACGDLIVTSSIPGKGMRQADDIVRASTVARAREAVTFTDQTDTAMIACVYMSG